MSNVHHVYNQGYHRRVNQCIVKKKHIMKMKKLNLVVTLDQLICFRYFLTDGNGTFPQDLLLCTNFN